MARWVGGTLLIASSLQQRRCSVLGGGGGSKGFLLRALQKERRGGTRSIPTLARRRTLAAFERSGRIICFVCFFVFTLSPAVIMYFLECVFAASSRCVPGFHTSMKAAEEGYLVLTLEGAPLFSGRS